MKNTPDKKLQVVSFSTSDSTKTPNDIINIFLGQQNHKIIKKTRHSLAFSLNLNNSSKDTTMMVYSILNLTREYTGITDVNCYLLFVDLEKEDSIKKLNDIIEYAKDFCDLMKKIYEDYMREAKVVHTIIFVVLQCFLLLYYVIIWRRKFIEIKTVIQKSQELINLIPEEIKYIMIDKINE